MFAPVRILLVGTMRDRISLIYALAFPLAVLIGLGIAFPNPGYRQQLLGSLVAVSGMFFALNGTGFQVLSHRSHGVYKLLRITPFSTAKFIASLGVARWLVALVCATVVYAVGALALGLQPALVEVLSTILIAAISIALFTLLGFISGNLSNKEEQVNSVASLLSLPMLFLSESFYSLAKAPGWIKALSRLSPFTYVTNGNHAATSGQLPQLVTAAMVLTAFVALALLIATATFRWDTR